MQKWFCITRVSGACTLRFLLISWYQSKQNLFYGSSSTTIQSSMCLVWVDIVVFWETLGQRNKRTTFLSYKTIIEMCCYFIIKCCPTDNPRKKYKATGLVRLDVESICPLHERDRAEVRGWPEHKNRRAEENHNKVQFLFWSII